MGQLYYTTDAKKVKPETEFEKALEEAKKDAFNVQPKLETVPAPIKKKSIVERVKEEILHYWHGSKLLAAETKISSRLLLKVLKGNTLSRREYRQLKRTTGDLLRLVPLVIIVLVPFLEFALPFLLKLFPNMLPSTFESKLQEEQRKKNLLMVRLNMAKFLQETVGEVALSGISKLDAAKEFNDFFGKVRVSGEQAATEDVLRVARKFQDELTLTNLSRPQLISLARFMNLNAFGTDALLRTIIENKLKDIKQDDLMIVRDGVDSLSMSELQNACSTRGITTHGASPARMRAEMNQWLELHLEHKIPSSLLLLSQAFQTSSRVLQPGTDALDSKAPALQATLSSLPHQVINEASLKISEQEGVATYKQKLDVLKEQEELIADELEEAEAEEELKRSKKEDEDARKIAKEEEMKKAEVSFIVDTPAELEQLIEDHTVKATADIEKETKSGADESLSSEELKKLAEALKTRNKDSLDVVKVTLNELKEDRQEFKEDVEEFKNFTQQETPKSSDRLGTRVDKMIYKLEQELVKYDIEIGSKLSLTKPDLEQGQISIQDLEETLKVIKENPNDERISKIVKQLDSDNDGLVAINEILSLAEKSEQKSESNKIDSAAQNTNSNSI